MIFLTVCRPVGYPGFGNHSSKGFKYQRNRGTLGKKGCRDGQKDDEQGQKDGEFQHATKVVGPINGNVSFVKRVDTEQISLI